MNEAIPEDAKQFLLNNIDSIAQWEGCCSFVLSPARIICLRVVQCEIAGEKPSLGIRKRRERKSETLVVAW